MCHANSMAQPHARAVLPDRLGGPLGSDQIARSRAPRSREECDQNNARAQGPPGQDAAERIPKGPALSRRRHCLGCSRPDRDGQLSFDSGSPSDSVGPVLLTTSARRARRSLARLDEIGHTGPNSVLVATYGSTLERRPPGRLRL